MSATRLIANVSWPLRGKRCPTDFTFFAPKEPTVHSHMRELVEKDGNNNTAPRSSAGPPVIFFSLTLLPLPQTSPSNPGLPCQGRGGRWGGGCAGNPGAAGPGPRRPG